MSVLGLIQSRARWNTQAIAQELECSERTVFRDLTTLKFAGVPIFYSEHEGCYRVRPDFRFPVLALTSDEAIGQSVASSLVSLPELAVSPGPAAVTRKIAAGSSAETQQVLTDANRLIEVLNLKFTDHYKHGEFIKTVQTALFNKRQLQGVYASPYENSSKKLTIHPIRLCLIKQSWYVIGTLKGEDAVKTFRLVRFRSLQLLDQPSESPSNFDLRAYLGNAWAFIVGTRPTTLNFASSVPQLPLLPKSIGMQVRKYAETRTEVPRSVLRSMG